MTLSVHVVTPAISTAMVLVPVGRFIHQFSHFPMFSLSKVSAVLGIRLE